MNYMKHFIAIIISVITLSSCGNYYTSSVKRTTSFTPNVVRLNLDIDDFEYLGKTEISVTYRKYLGLFKVIDSVNNRPYNYRDQKFLRLSGKSDIKLNAEMNKAVYKVIDEYPDATYYIVVNDYQRVHRMFLGKLTLRTMEIQAFKYKIETN